MKKYFFIYLITLLSCNYNKLQQEQIINDSFLDVVGTQGYGGSIIPPPPLPTDTIVKIKEFVLEISSEIEPLSKWKESIASFLITDSKYAQYKSLLNDSFKQKELNKRLHINMISRTGRYKLKEAGLQNNKSRITRHTIGKVQFSDVVFDLQKGLAAYIVTISDGPKAGKIKLVLLRLDKQIWKVVHEELVEVW